MRTIFRRLSLLLLAAVGAAAWLQAALPESGKVYKINNIHDGWTFGENNNGVLTNVNAATTEDLKQLWVCVVKDGKYAFVNAKSGKCLKAGSGSGSAWTTDTLASYFYLVSQGTQAADATYGAGLEYFAISTTQGATNQTCLHCWASATPKNWTKDGGGSRWTFTEATTTLAAVNTNLSAVFTRYNAVLTDASNVAASFGVGSPYALQCTHENADFYVSTNADQNTGGGAQDGNGIAGLIDKNYDTFLHTRYDGTAVSGAHHIQVKMTTGLSSFRFFYRTRPGGTNFVNKPTTIVISGSNDGTDFTTITTLSSTDAQFPLPSNTTSIENYISPIISSGTAYQYLRFEVTATNNNTAFFTLGEFALMAAGTNEYPRAGELTADLAGFYKTFYPLVGTTIASAVDLPNYYSNASTLAAATATVKAALTASEIATGTLADKLTYIKYHIYYTDAEGVKHYLHINDSHQLAISTTPASFAFAEGVTTDGYAAKAYYMHMGGYHPGHWETDGSGFNVDESTSNNVGIWHSQVFYFDETTGKYAIRNTNAKNSRGYQCNYFICHDDSNAPVGRVLSNSNDATAIYQWTVRPDYPFEITADDNNPTTYLIMTRYTESDYTENTYAYDGSNSKTTLAEINPTADAQKWYFKEVEDNGKFYVQIYSVANNNHYPMSYANSSDGATKIIAQAEGTSGYSSYFFLDSENGQAPYYFRPTDLANYLSNNGGKTKGMGFWNSRTDNGSKIFFTPTDLYGDFIRLKGNFSNYYADASANSGNGYISMKSAEACSPTGSVFYLTPEGRLLSYAKGLYTTNTCQLMTETGTEGADIIYFWARDDKDDPTKKYYILQKKAGSGSRWIYDDGGNNEVDRQNTVDAAHCNWTVEKVENLPVNVSTTAKWATLYAPVPLTIPADVDAYTASISGTTCTLTGVTGSVPANTGLILHKAGGGLTNFAVAESASPLGSTNVLSGTIETTATPSSCYTLQLNNSDATKVGLYSYNGANVQGFRAYYAAGSNSVQAYLFSFGDEDITGINATQQDIDLQGSDIYDLTGRKVNRPAKGLYVVNGRKVYFK